MAWTAPRTWAVSEVVTAVMMNTHVRDNLIYLKTAVDALEAGTYPAVLDNQYAAAGVGNVGVGETILMTYTVPANTLDANDRALRVMISGTCAATANNKVFRFYFGGVGGTKLWDSGATVINGEWFVIEAQITRVGVGSQYSTVGGLWARGAPGADLQSQERTASAEDETLALDVVFTGQSAVGADEIKAHQMVVELTS